MKAFVRFLLFFLLTPWISSAQVLDTAAVRIEVDSLIEVSRNMAQGGNPDDAIQLLTIAASKSSLAFGMENNLYAKCILYKGWCYSLKNDANQAESLYLEGLKIQKKIFGDKNIKCVSALTSLGKLYRSNLSYDKAEAVYLEALAIREVSLGKMHPDYAQNLEILATIYYYKGSYDKSEAFNLEAKSIREQILGKKHKHYLASLNNLGVLYQGMAKYEQAEVCYGEIKQILESMPEKLHTEEYATCLSNLGSLYGVTGFYEKAEPLFLQAKNLQAEIHGTKGADYAQCLANMASLYASMGNYDQALVLLSEAKPIFEKTPGDKDPLYAWVLNNFGTLYYHLKDYKKAEDYYVEAKNIIEKNTGTENGDYANSLKNLALVYGELNDHTKAEQLLQESIRIQATLNGKENLEYVILLNNLASIYGNMGNHTKANQLLLESLSLYKKILGNDGPDYIELVHGLAKSYLSQNKVLEALPYYAEADSIEQRRLILSLKHLSENETDKYLRSFSKYQDAFYAFASKVKTAAPGFVSQMYSNLLFKKGFLLEAVSKRNNLLQNDTAATQRNNLQKYYLRLLAKEYAKPLAERDAVRMANWAEKANALEKELARTVAGYDELYRQVSWREVRDKLHPGEAAVEMVAYRNYTPGPTDSILYAALVLLPSDTAPHFVPLFEERQLQAFFNRTDLNEQYLVENLYGPNSELYNLVWTPLEPLLRDAKSIYYSLAGLLHRINPGALLDAREQPLSADRQWVRVNSTRELVTGRLADGSFAHTPERPDAAALIFGGIQYDMDSIAFTRANPLDAGTQAPPGLVRKDGKFRYMAEAGLPERPSGTRGPGDHGWKSLAGTAREAELVSASLRQAGFHTEVRSGYQASEECFKTIGVREPSPRILHIATHGFSYPDPKIELQESFVGAEPTYKLQDDPMLRSGLLMAGANYYWNNKRPLENREDGVLVAYEVRDLNLRHTELAVLSACQTGLGDVLSSEGVYGLQRAFRMAGVKFLIVSLWQVPDEQTQELMRLFYENWGIKQESLRDAFNHAQNTLREKEPNPYIWAAFVLIE